MALTIKDKISELQSTVATAEVHLSKLYKLIEQFPDLKVHTNRWKHERYYTHLVNHLVNEVDIYHSCGCCSDAALLVSPYLIIDEIKIHSDPPSFYVGTRADYAGDYFNDNWQKTLQEKNISSVVIDKIEDYQNKNFPNFDEDLDEDNQDDYNS